MISIAIWTIVYTLELGSSTMQMKVLWAQMRFVGIGPMAASWLITTLHHTGYVQAMPRRGYALLAIEPLATAILSLTSGAHRLFRYNYRLEGSGPFSMLVYDNGPFFWVHYIYMEVIFVFCIVLLVRSLPNRKPWFRRQTITMIIGTILPLACDILFQTGLLPMHGYNASPAVMAVSGLIMASSVFRYRSLAIVPIARSVVVENMTDLMLVVDDQDRLVDFNPAAESTLELDPSRSIGLSAEAVLGPWSDILDHAPQRATVTREIVKRTRGRERAYDLSASPIVGKSGAPMGRMLILHEITERKAVETALRESEARFRGFIEQSSQSVILADEQGFIIEFNPSAEQLTGLQRHKVLGTHAVDLLFQLLPGDTLTDGRKGRAFEAFQQTLRDGRGEPLAHPYAGSLVQPDGSRRDFRMEAFPIRTEKGWRIGFVCQDITALKKAEDALKKSEEQLIHAQKMEAVGRLAGGIAHDFNNLLTVINGYAQMMEHEIPDGTPMKENMGEIVNAADRAASLTTQLLTFSRKQVLEPRTIDPNRLIAGMERMLRRVIGEDVELATALQPGIGSIIADPGRIEQVLMNLAVNAKDAMPQGGQLTITTSAIDLAPGESSPPLAEMPPGRWICIAVSDTGIGMDESVRTRIFEPFFTTKEEGKGTGLGLATVYGITTQSGGYITCKSLPRHGTTFVIYLPGIEDSSQPADSQRSLEQAARGSGTVLLVEDEESVRRFTGSVLEKNGYSVARARNGEEALDVIRTFKAEIRLVITDLVMPKMGGVELAQRIRAEMPQVAILFTSGYTDDSLKEVERQGAAFLRKPFSIKELLDKVSGCIEGLARSAAEADHED